MIRYSLLVTFTIAIALCLVEVLAGAGGHAHLGASSGVISGKVTGPDESYAVRTEYGYEPFGKASASGAANDNPSQFTGRDEVRELWIL